jgi:pimeloyl-ACP methyl ester carboxylesterase
MLPTVVYPDLATAQARFRLMPDEGAIAPEVLAEVARHSLTPVAGGYTLKFDRESFYGRDGIDVLAAMRAIRVPMLLIRAEHSRVLTAEAARAARACNPMVKLIEMPGAHHHVLLEQPAELARLIMDFAAELR